METDIDAFHWQMTWIQSTSSSHAGAHTFHNLGMIIDLFLCLMRFFRTCILTIPSKIVKSGSFGLKSDGGSSRAMEVSYKVDWRSDGEMRVET